MNHNCGKIPQLGAEIDELIRKKEHSTKTATMVPLYNQILVEMDKIDDQKFRHITPGTNEGMRLEQKGRRIDGLRKVNKWMSPKQKLKDEFTAIQTPLEGPLPVSTTEEETELNSPADHQAQENSLIITSDDNTPQETLNNVSKTVERQEHEAAVDDNPNITSVSVLLPETGECLADKPENLLGSLGKKPSSNTLSRSSRRRAKLKAEVLEDEARPKIERKQHELELRRKERELTLEQIQLQKKIETESQKEQLIWQN